jgi:hypothetical protein
MTTRKEVNAVIKLVLGLPALAKFEVFDALREDLAGVLSEENPENRRVRERREALLVIKRVAEHLDLPADKAPTTKQFNEVADQLVEGWDSARVTRLWERWRMAKDSYLGTRRIDSPASRKRRGRLRGHVKRGNQEEHYFDSVKRWLDSEPELLTKPAYDEFAEIYNADLRAGDQPLIRAETIRRGLPLDWLNIVAVARGDLTMDEALKTELAEQLPTNRKDALVGLAAIAKLFNRPSERMENLAREDKDFPVPVAHIRGNRAWLYEDMKLYKRGLEAPKRTEDELQSQFMDAHELGARLDLKFQVLQRIIWDQRWDRAPQPEGAIATGYYYWKRAKVETWLQPLEEQEAKEAEDLERQKARAQAIGASLAADKKSKRSRKSTPRAKPSTSSR